MALDRGAIVMSAGVNGRDGCPRALAVGVQRVDIGGDADRPAVGFESLSIVTSRSIVADEADTLRRRHVRAPLRDVNRLRLRQPARCGRSRRPDTSETSSADCPGGSPAGSPRRGRRTASGRRATRRSRRASRRRSGRSARRWRRTSRRRHRGRSICRRPRPE